MILAGDPKQLGPVRSITRPLSDTRADPLLHPPEQIIRSPVATAHGLATSYLERLMKLVPYSSNEARGVTFVKLLDNYRSHPSILQFPNSEFYEGELRNCAARSTSHRLEKWKGWPNDKFPIIFHALSGGDAREGNSPSFFNVAEISQVKAYVNALRDARPRMINDNDIGIISPYASQVKKLRRAINADGKSRRAERHLAARSSPLASRLQPSWSGRPRTSRAKNEGALPSFARFAGVARSAPTLTLTYCPTPAFIPIVAIARNRFIIMSTVRSNRSFLEMDKRFSLGFRSNPKRFNVAITRAQAGLIIVGDPDILALDPPWRREFLSLCSR